MYDDLPNRFIPIFRKVRSIRGIEGFGYVIVTFLIVVNAEKGSDLRREQRIVQRRYHPSVDRRRETVEHTCVESLQSRRALSL